MKLSNIFCIALLQAVSLNCNVDFTIFASRQSHLQDGLVEMRFAIWMVEIDSKDNRSVANDAAAIVMITIIIDIHQIKKLSILSYIKNS